MMTTTQTQFARKTDSLRTAVRLGVGVIVFDERGWIVLEQRGDCGLWGLTAVTAPLARSETPDWRGLSACLA